MVLGRRASSAESVGTGGGNGDAGAVNELECEGMGGHADSYQRPSGGDGVGDGGGSRERRVGPGQKAAMRASVLSARAGELSATCFSMLRSQMCTITGSQDGRSFAEDLRNCLGIKRVGAKAIDGFGGKGDRATVSQQLCGAQEAGFAR